MKNPFSSDLLHVARGVLMGGADIVPGVSGGTVALVLGIYERLVTAISHCDLALLGLLGRRAWREAAEHVDLRFLIALGAGIACGIVGLATAMNYLLENHLQPTLAVFFGLILGSTVLVARMIPRCSAAIVLLMLVGAGGVYWLVAQPFMTGREGYPYLFFCGMVAICAMILPGISGAFILLLLGKYAHVTGVLRGLVHGEVTAENLLTVVVFSAGCVVGLLAFSKVLRWLLVHHHAATMAVLCGVMLGSLRRIWPFKAVSAGEAIDIQHAPLRNVWPDALTGDVVLAAALVVVAVAFVLVLDRLSRRQSA